MKQNLKKLTKRNEVLKDKQSASAMTNLAMLVLAVHRAVVPVAEIHSKDLAALVAKGLV